MYYFLILWFISIWKFMRLVYTAKYGQSIVKILKVNQDVWLYCTSSYKMIMSDMKSAVEETSMSMLRKDSSM